MKDELMTDLTPETLADWEDHYKILSSVEAHIIHTLIRALRAEAVARDAAESALLSERMSGADELAREKDRTKEAWKVAADRRDEARGYLLRAEAAEARVAALEAGINALSAKHRAEYEKQSALHDGEWGSHSYVAHWQFAEELDALLSPTDPSKEN